MFGNDKDSVQVGQEQVVSVKVTDKMVHQFAEMSGDFNPIHLDDAYAKSTRFGRRIAHGMITASLISRSLTETLGEGGVYLGQSMKFVGPVFIDETIHISLKITNLRRERGIAVLETNVNKENGDPVLKGEATIMFTWGLEKSNPKTT